MIPSTLVALTPIDVLSFAEQKGGKPVRSPDKRYKRNRLEIYSNFEIYDFA